MSFLEKVLTKRPKSGCIYFPLFKTLAPAEDGNANHDVGDDDDAAFHDSFQHASWLNKNNDGDGIRFFRGDMKGLETKLNYLLAEYRAGSRVISHSKPNCTDSRRAPTKEKDIEKRIRRHQHILQ